MHCKSGMTAGAVWDVGRGMGEVMEENKLARLWQAICRVLDAIGAAFGAHEGPGLVAMTFM